jgi:hypothetical protein
MAAGAAALRADRPEARRLYHEALDRWRSLGLSWDLALCQADYALLLGDESDAHERAAEARATFTRLGATTMLAQLDAHARHRAGVRSGSMDGEPSAEMPRVAGSPGG